MVLGGGFSSSLRALPKAEEGGGGFALLKVENPLVAGGRELFWNCRGVGGRSSTALAIIISKRENKV